MTYLLIYQIWNINVGTPLSFRVISFMFLTVNEDCQMTKVNVDVEYIIIKSEIVKLKKMHALTIIIKIKWCLLFSLSFLLVWFSQKFIVGLSRRIIILTSVMQCILREKAIGISKAIFLCCRIYWVFYFQLPTCFPRFSVLFFFINTDIYLKPQLQNYIKLVWSYELMNSWLFFRSNYLNIT